MWGSPVSDNSQRIASQHPRFLTVEQTSEIRKVLANYPKQTIVVFFNPGDIEAFAYAQDFIAIFDELGWDVEVQKYDFRGSFYNVSVSISSDKPVVAPAGALGLLYVLVRLKLTDQQEIPRSSTAPTTVKISTTAKIKTGEIGFLVGPKPSQPTSNP